MKCPKCRYVSHDYLDACRKCGVELVSFKKDIGLLVVQPGVLDLSRVLGEAGADDLFASMGEDIGMHAGNDDDFEISLDADPAHAEAQHAHVEAPQAGARETAESNTGLDHLTLELDISALSMELAAHRQTAPALPDTPPEPPTPAVPPAAPPEEGMSPGHMTLELEFATMTTELPPGMLEDLAAMPPPRVPETAAPEEVLDALDLDVSLDSASLAAALDPAERSEMVESPAAEPAAGVDAAASVAEVAGATASLPLQDIVLAEVTPVGPEEQEPERSDPPISVFEMLDVDVAVESLEAGQGAEPSGSDRAEVVEPDRSPVDAPGAEEVSLWPGFELAEATPEDTLTSADISALEALENLQESTLSRHLTLDLSAPDPGPEQGAEQGLTTSDALPLGDLDAMALPGHLTLDLDVSQLMADWSSTTLDDVQLDDPPGAGQSATSPPQEQAGDEEELLLDLDDVALDDDTKA